MNALFKESDFPKDFLFQIISLFVSIVFIHSIYLLFIDPAATFQVALAESENRPGQNIINNTKGFRAGNMLNVSFMGSYNNIHKMEKD